MSEVSQALLIVGLIVSILAIIAILYLILALRRISIVAKKVDYFVEDLTYKSEMLNSTVETISKMTNYIDVFEVVVKKNIKAATRLAIRNRDQLYKVAERVKDLSRRSRKGSK